MLTPDTPGVLTDGKKTLYQDSQAFPQGIPPE